MKAILEALMSALLATSTLAVFGASASAVAIAKSSGRLGARTPDRSDPIDRGE